MELSDLADAETDEVSDLIASTFDPNAIALCQDVGALDRGFWISHLMLVMEQFPLNALIKILLAASRGID